MAITAVHGLSHSPAAPVATPSTPSLLSANTTANPKLISTQDSTSNVENTVFGCITIFIAILGLWIAWENGAKSVPSKSSNRLPIHQAAQNGHFDTMELLLEHDITEIDVEDSRGWRLLTFLSRLGV
ncbi:hypothetical protein F4810DRAFT_708756 [Camillea tinctor]|nr:hypothetical protein F4810DRAFT_708756 [Camillea tinctor]